MGCLLFFILILIVMLLGVKMTLLIGIGGFIVLIIIGAVNSPSSKEMQDIKKSANMYLARKGIESQEFPIRNRQITMAMDTSSKKIFYCKGDLYTRNMDYESDITIIEIANILSIELVEDDVAIQSVSKGQALTGAVLGGAIAGGVGAIIGSNTASSSLKRKVKNITLRFKLNSMTSPYKEAIVFKSSNGVMSDDLKLKKEFDDTLNFVARIEMLMKN